MKKLFLFSCFLFLISDFLVAQNQNVGIGTTSPNARAQLDITSNNKGILIPRLTTTQRNNIVNPPAGLMIYNSTTQNYNVYDGTTWKAMQKELPAGVMVIADTGQNGGLSELGFSFNGNLYMNYRPPSLPVTIPDSTWYSLNQDDPDSINNPIDDYSGFLCWTGTEVLYLRSDSNFRYNPTTDRWIFHSNIFTSDTITGILPKGVWTGTEVIFWNGGGNNNSKIYRFNPQTNSFSVNSVFYPSVQRMYYSFLWTGSKIIMWGGSDQYGGSLNDGGVFDPVTNLWTGISIPFSLVTQLPPRSFHTAVWTGTEMLIWGGEIKINCVTPPNQTIVSIPEVTNTGFRFNPSTMQFNAIPAGSDARAGHNAIWLDSVMIILGGYRYLYQYPCSYHTQEITNGGKYNPGLNTWSGTPLLGSSNHALLIGEKIIIFGAQKSISSYSPITNSLTFEGYCPAFPYYNKSIWTGSKIITLTKENNFNNYNDFLQAHAYSMTNVTLMQAQTIRSKKFSLWQKN